MAGVKHTVSSTPVSYEFQYNAPVSVSLPHSVLHSPPFFICIFLSKTTQNNALASCLFFPACFCAWRVCQGGSSLSVDIPVHTTISAADGVGTGGTHAKDKTVGCGETRIYMAFSTPLACYGVSSL